MKTPEDSYRASSHIALRGEANTVAEILMKPCAVEMETCELGEESKKKLKTVNLSNNTVNLSINTVNLSNNTVNLSNNTVKHHIQDLSADAEKQLVSQLISSFACFVES
jgi:hypothetical protein